MSEIVRLVSKSHLTFDDVAKELTDILFQPDLEAFHIMISAVAAHFMNPCGFPPVWLMIIGPSGSGKTTMIETLSTIPNIWRLNDLTPKTFMSGYHGGKNPEKDNSLLAKMGVSAVITMKDFTTILSMRNESKAEIMAQLREIYDGFYRKAWGMGEVQTWAGRITIITCCTPAIDQDRMTFRLMGDRFMEVRWGCQEPENLARYIGNNRVKLDLTAIREKVKQYLADCSKTCPNITPAQINKLSAIARMTARLRTPVIRDMNHWKIVGVGVDEAPSRILQSLMSIVMASAALDHQDWVRETDMQLAYRMSHDSVPTGRLETLKYIGMEGLAEKMSSQIPLNRWARDRVLADLLALGILEKVNVNDAEVLLMWHSDIALQVQQFLSDSNYQ